MKIRHIGIFCSMDKFANSIRPVELKKYLSKKGYKVTIVSNTNIYKNDQVNNSSNRFSNSIFYKIIYSQFDKYINGKLYYYYFKLLLNLRRLKLRKIIKISNFDLIIFENHIQAFVAKDLKNIPYILDLDIPYIDELFYSKKIDKNSYNKLIFEFKNIYKKAYKLNFQWYKYSEYVKRNIYDGENFIEINFGCNVKSPKLRTKFNRSPKIICLGYLGGKWVNLPLLSKLSKIYPIDVFGGPEPDKKWGLNYKGYTPDINILSNYQFGLITISKDKLRCNSFSSKHLEYISFGLPVLTPEWRKDKILSETSIYYNENNFLNKINEWSNYKKWSRKSELSYNKSIQLNWNNVLKSLKNELPN